MPWRVTPLIGAKSTSDEKADSIFFFLSPSSSLYISRDGTMAVVGRRPSVSLHSFSEMTQCGVLFLFGFSSPELSLSCTEIVHRVDQERSIATMGRSPSSLPWVESPMQGYFGGRGDVVCRTPNTMLWEEKYKKNEMDDIGFPAYTEMDGGEAEIIFCIYFLTWG